HDKAAAPQDRELIQLRIPHPEEGTIPDARAIACTTLRVTSRVQIQATDKSRTRREPTIRFAARAQATRSARKIPQRIRLAETATAPRVAQSRRAGERSNKTGSAWRSTTTPR